MSQDVGASVVGSLAKELRAVQFALLEQAPSPAQGDRMKMPRRTLDQVSDAEWADLKDELYQWLDRVDCAGSVAGIYSLYEALEEQRERALHAARQRKP